MLPRFQAEQTGSMTLFKIKCSGSGNVKVAIYTNASGAPGNLLAAVDTGTPVVAGWNSLNITATPVTLGTYYWLAVNSDSNIVLFAPTPGSGVYGYRAATYSTFTFPAPAGSGFSNGSGYTTLLAGYAAGP